MATIEELLRLQGELDEYEADDDGAHEALEDLRERVAQCCDAWAACEAALKIEQAKSAALQSECSMLKSAHEQAAALANGAHGHMKMYQDAIAMKDAALSEHAARYDAKCMECDNASRGLRDAQVRIESLQQMLSDANASRAAADDRLNQALSRVEQPRMSQPIKLPPPPQYTVEFGPADGNGRVRSATIKPVKE